MVTQSHHAEMSAVKAIALKYMPARVVTRDVSLKERRDEAVIPSRIAHLGTTIGWPALTHHLLMSALKAAAPRNVFDKLRTFDTSLRVEEEW